MAESLYTGITIQGLYSDQTGDQLFGVTGSPVPASVLYIGGKDNNGNLAALSLNASGALVVSPSSPTDTTATGAITSTETVSLSTQGASTVSFNITGTWTGTIDFETSQDGTNWVATNAYTYAPWAGGAASATANGQWTLPAGGYNMFRVRGNTVATGSATIWIEASEGNQTVYAVQPSASQLNATVQQGGAPWSVTVSGTVAVTQSTSPWVVSLTSTTITGTVAVTQSTSPWVVAGNLTHNNAAPTADNVGVLPALANAAPPTFTEGDQVLLSTDLAGNLRTTATFSGTVTVAGNKTNNNAAPNGTNIGALTGLAATSYTTNTYTTGNLVLPVTDLHGALNEDLQAVAGVQLGATGVTAFGTAPAAVNVEGVNANIYQAGAAISTANPLFTNISDGTNALTANAITAWGTAPTGHVLGVNAELFVGNNAVSGTAPVPISATTAANTSGNPIFVSSAITGNVTVVGTLTNNNAAPTTTNVGVLPAIAAAGTFPAVTIQAATAGDQELLTVSQGGSLITVPADEEYASHISYYSVDTGATLKTVTSAIVFPLISIRSSSAAIQYLVREVQGFTDGTQELVQLIKNPQTLTGSTFAATAPTGSHVTVDTAATAVTIGTGTVVWSGFASSAPAGISNILSSLAAGAPGDVYTVACQKFGTGTSKAGGQIFWSEVAAAI